MALEKTHMNTEIVNPTGFPYWDEHVMSYPKATFFHSSSWARVLSESYGYKPLYFTIFDGDTLSACLPVMEIDTFLTGKRGVSLPFTDFCDPLAFDTARFCELFDAAVDCGRNHGWKSLELRGGGEFLDSALPSSTYFTHVLDLTCNLEPATSNLQQVSPSPPYRGQAQSSVPLCGPQSAALRPVRQFASSPAVFSQFRDSTRRNIKKALEAGVRVDISTTGQAVKEFYRLNLMTRKEHGLPPQPYHFFEKVYEHVISKGHGFIAAAFYKDAAIASNVYFHFGTTAVYKYGASDKRYQHLRANNLVMWEAIRWLSGHGFSNLHFGRTDLDHAGLRQFKAGWGTVESELRYYRFNMRTSAFVSNGSGPAQGLANKVFAHTPLPVLRAVGSLLYKHVG
jgi:hypothetical protein